LEIRRIKSEYTDIAIRKVPSDTLLQHFKIRQRVRRPRIIIMFSAPLQEAGPMQTLTIEVTQDHIDRLSRSHDLEDFVAVIEGRDTLLHEIAESPQELRRYLAEAATTLLAEPRFFDVLPGFVLDNERVPLIQERLAELIRQG
jgi:hypothetical protein